MDVPQQGTEPTLTDEKPAQQPENPGRLQALEKRLAKLGEWALSAQEGFRGLQEKQDLIAADLASHQAALQTQQQAAAVDVVMGYRPSPEQLIQLFEALAQWQHSAPEVEKSARASFRTKEDNEGKGAKDVNYSYATPGEISSLARTAGEVGLAHWHREIVHSEYSVIRTYLLHKSGGFIYTDVPLLTRENKLLSPMQVWSVANTSARRLGLLSVLGIMPSDTDDDGNPRQQEGQANGRGRSIRAVGASHGSGTGLGDKPPPLPEANIRRIPSASKPAAVGPEPGQLAAPISTTTREFLQKPAGYAPA